MPIRMCIDNTTFVSFLLPFVRHLMKSLTAQKQDSCRKFVLHEKRISDPFQTQACKHTNSGTKLQTSPHTCNYRYEPALCAVWHLGTGAACRKNLTDLSLTKLSGNSVCKIWLRSSCFALGPPPILQTSFPDNFVGPVRNIKWNLVK